MKLYNSSELHLYLNKYGGGRNLHSDGAIFFKPKLNRVPEKISAKTEQLTELNENACIYQQKDTSLCDNAFKNNFHKGQLGNFGI